MTTKTEKSNATRAAFMRKVILQQNNKAARNFYGVPLHCDRIIIDTEEREIKINNETARAFKTSFHTIEEGWVDSFTAASKATAEFILTEWAGGTEEFEPIGIEFFGQVTRRHKEQNGGDGRETDSVRVVGFEAAVGE